MLDSNYRPNKMAFTGRLQYICSFGALFSHSHLNSALRSTARISAMMRLAREGELVLRFASAMAAYRCGKLPGREMANHSSVRASWTRKTSWPVSGSRLTRTLFPRITGGGTATGAGPSSLALRAVAAPVAASAEWDK